MTHHVTKHHRPTPVSDGIANIGTGGVTEEYMCTDEELERAGFHVIDAEDMPEHESEFCPNPWGGDAPQIRPGAGLGELIELFGPDPYPPEAA
jgi:hypothetical protein